MTAKELAQVLVEAHKIVEYVRMTREELVDIGWKGVDIYRKDG